MAITRATVPMAKTVDTFLSIQSPYSYFATPRLMRLDTHPAVNIEFRLVAPGVLRLPEAYENRSSMEQDYFLVDVRRTADFLGLDYAEADPYPVAFEPNSLWRASCEQHRAYELIDLLLAASRDGKGLALFDNLMRLIWNGKTRNWHMGHHIRDAVSSIGLHFGDLKKRIDRERDSLRTDLLANNDALLAAGHWGVPCFVLDGEPFYGQDRFDQLLWRLGISGDDLPKKNF